VISHSLGAYVTVLNVEGIPCHPASSISVLDTVHHCGSIAAGIGFGFAYAIANFRQGNHGLDLIVIV